LGALSQIHHTWFSLVCQYFSSVFYPNRLIDDVPDL
jgi:hypothetical protein